MRKIKERIRLVISVEKVLICMCFVLAIISYTYQDAVITQRHGIEVWNALSQGRLFDYYNYCIQNTSCAAAYDFTLYLFFAIWNFPVWIFEKLSGMNAQNLPFFVIYGKGLIVVAWVGCYIVTKKIYNSISGYSSDMQSYNPAFFLLSSLLLTVYSIYTGNYDILALFFILLGIYSLFKENIKGFVVMFAIAISMKYFAAWIFIPLVLIFEKKSIKY